MRSSKINWYLKYLASLFDEVRWLTFLGHPAEWKEGKEGNYMSEVIVLACPLASSFSTS